MFSKLISFLWTLVISLLLLYVFTSLLHFFIVLFVIILSFILFLKSDKKNFLYNFTNYINNIIKTISILFGVLFSKIFNIILIKPKSSNVLFFGDISYDVFYVLDINKHFGTLTFLGKLFHYVFLGAGLIKKGKY